MQGLAGWKMLKGAPLATGQVHQRGGTQLEGETVFAVGTGAVVQHGVDRLQALDRLAQRPCRQATSVAQATGVVDQHQLQVSGHPIMLHAVVGQDQVQRFGLQQCLDGATAIRVDHQRHTGALDNQQRLVTRDVGALLGRDPPRQLRRLGAVTPADHADPQATALAVLDHPQDQRRLAGAANGDIAHHDQRHGGW